MIPEILTGEGLIESYRTDMTPEEFSEFSFNCQLWMRSSLRAVLNHAEALAAHRNNLMREKLLLAQQNNQLLSQIADLEDRIKDIEGDGDSFGRRLRVTERGMLLVDVDDKTYFLTRWQRFLYRAFGIWPDPY